MPAEHCIVTGSASGIGLALTRRLLADGWRVTGIDREPHPAELSGAFVARQVDLLATDCPAGALPGGEAAPLTAFVHCAGMMRGDSHPEVRRDGGEALWRLHAAIPGQLVDALSPRLVDGRGRIVLMSSRAIQGRAGRSRYGSSKAAADGLARSLAAEFLPRGITVNTVAPASTDTPMLRDGARAEALVLPLPIGRLIRAEEVAALIGFLIGPFGGAITGQTIVMCGGASIPGLAR